MKGVRPRVVIPTTHHNTAATKISVPEEGDYRNA